MSPKQKKLAAKAPPPNKIDAKDFAVLKAEKAKGRGMGLQDEKAKPGKVIKARDGKAIKKDPTTPVNPFEKRRKQLGGGRSKLPGRIGTALGIGAMMVPAAYAAMKQYKDYKSAKNRDKAKVKKYNKGGGADASRKTFPSMDAMRKAKGFKPGETPSQFNKRRMMLEGAKKAAKATKIGKIAAGIGAVGVAASQFLKKKMEEKKENKKMVGGMAKKYNKGGEGRLRSAYIYDQTVKNTKAEGKGRLTLKNLKETRREEYGAAKDRYPSKKDKLKGIAKKVGSLAPFMPTVSVAKGVYDKLNQSTVRKYSVGGGADLGKKGIIKGINANLQDKAERRLNVPDRTDIKKQKASVTKLKQQARRSRLETMKDRQTGRPVYERMGGGMIAPSQRPGYSKGTMVKARGCKLGRTRPTKIT